MHEALLLQSFPEEMLNARCSIFNVQVGYGSYQINVALLNETDELLPCFSFWFLLVYFYCWLLLFSEACVAFSKDCYRLKN